MNGGMASICIVACLSIAFGGGMAGMAFSDECEEARHGLGLMKGTKDAVDRRTAFEQAVALCPHDAVLRTLLGDTLRELALADVINDTHLFDLAVTHYVKAVSTNPDLIQAHLGMGQCYAAMGLYEKAELAFKHALACNPEDQEAKQCLSAISEALKSDKSGLTRSSEIVAAATRPEDSEEATRLMGFRKLTRPKSKQTKALEAGPDSSPQKQPAPEERPNAPLDCRQRFTNILFDEWSADLTRKETLEQLQEIGKALSSQDLANLQFVVEGHTDNRGPEERNMKLSWDRANAVKKYLVDDHRIAAERISVHGFGPTRPRVENDGPTERLKNRRVEILFLNKPSK